MNTSRLRNILAFVLPLIASIATAQEPPFVGTVISVSAGDILKVEHNGKQELVVLYGIECPRSIDAYGQEAKEFLSDQVLGREVQVAVIEKKHGLTYTEVFLGDGPSVNELILKAGLAKWDKLFAPDRTNYGGFQAQAEEDGVGIWHRATAPEVEDYPLLIQARKDAGIGAVPVPRPSAADSPMVVGGPGPEIGQPRTPNLTPSTRAGLGFTPMVQDAFILGPKADGLSVMRVKDWGSTVEAFVHNHVCVLHEGDKLRLLERSSFWSLSSEVKVRVETKDVRHGAEGWAPHVIMEGAREASLWD